MTADSLESLMKRALAGDNHAYGEALRQSAQLLQSYLHKRLSNKAAVDDVVQEVLVSLHKALRTYDGKRPYKPWLFAIARFRLKDYLRAHYKDRLYQAEELDKADFNSLSHVTEPALNYESLKEEIGRLPKKQATIVYLMHKEGYTAKEVADKIGMSESLVKVSAHRAFKILKRKLRNE